MQLMQTKQWKMKQIYRARGKRAGRLIAWSNILYASDSDTHDTHTCIYFSSKNITTI